MKIQIQLGFENQTVPATGIPGRRK